MADIPKIQSSPLQSRISQHPVLEEDERISSELQTLYDSDTDSSSLVEDDDLADVYDGGVPCIDPFTLDVEDDDLVSVDYEGVRNAFIVDPFSSIDSSFFVPPSSSSYHHHHQVNSNSCSCCSSQSESFSDYLDSTVCPDFLHGHDEEYDQMSFITDLFDSRGETEHVSGHVSNTDVGISVSENSAVNNHDNDFVSNSIDDLGLGYEAAAGGGLRVARIESDSDTEDLGADQTYDRIQSTDLNLQHISVDDRDGLSSVIDRIEEISVSSDISSEGEAAPRVLEWEILLAVNNLERNLDLATDGEEGFVYTPEFDTLIGQFVETVRALRGSPPAAKSFIDNLPLVEFKKRDLKDDGGDDDDDDTVTCAVCKDEILMEERVVQLPCKHHYHGECIVPWLSIRNTCPVCRFELPTDDVDYERSKNRVNDDDELRVGYGFNFSS